MRAVFNSFKNAVTNAIHGKAEQRVFLAGNSLRTHLLLSLTNEPPRTGRTYRIPGTNKTYTASAPGEYPALATGELRASVAQAGVKVERTFGGVRAELGEGIAPHGLALEKGLRPWFSKGFDEKKKDLEREIGRRWF